MLRFNKTVFGSPLNLTIARDTVFTVSGSRVLPSPFILDIRDNYQYSSTEVITLRQINGTVAVVAEASRYARSLLMVPGMIFVLADLLEFVQIISYSIFLDVDYPANLRMLLECFYESSSLDFLPIKLTPPFPQNLAVRRPFLYEYYDFSFSFLYDNFIGIAAMNLYCACFVVLWIVSKSKSKNCVITFIRKYFGRTLYSRLINSYLTCYLPLFFSAVVSVTNAPYRNIMEAVSHSTAWFTIGLAIIVLFTHPTLLFSVRNSKDIDTTECYGQSKRAGRYS